MPEIQLPKPEEVAGALAAFPPKLSVLAKPLATPEDLFESTVKATGVELPPGPAKMLVGFMESLEAGAPALPAGFPALPALPGVPAPSSEASPAAQTQTKAQPRRTGKIDVEVF